jgi:uncharacterized protein (TIGR03086 family)
MSGNPQAEEDAMELMDAYRRGLREFAGRVPQVRADQWSGPTPCADWDVRTLVNHLVYEERWAVPLFAGATVADVGDKFEGDLLGANPARAVREAARDAEAAIGGDPQRPVHLSFGDFPAAEYAYQLLADHLIHAWDLAVAIDNDPRLDPELVRTVGEWFADKEETYRMAGAIGPRVPQPAGASEQDRLLGLFGRDPNWVAKD